MNWLTIIMTLLSFFASKKSGASGTKSALIAGLVGAGTYYTTHNTDWGRANLGFLDGVGTAGGGVETPSVDGQPVKDSGGNALENFGGGVTGVLKSWGATGTAAVIGTTALATSSSLQKYIPLLLIGGAVLLLSR